MFHDRDEMFQFDCSNLFARECGNAVAMRTCAKTRALAWRGGYD